MQYSYKTKAELDELNRKLEPGIYEFEVIEAEEAVSRNNDQMMVLTLAVIDREGRKHFIKDWLVSTEKALFKIRAFWHCVGHPEFWKNANAEAYNFSNQRGRGDFVIVKEKSTDGREFTKVRLKEYIFDEIKAVKFEEESQTANTNDFPDNDIPF